jgi:peroxiredoxin Q/BCP
LLNEAKKFKSAGATVLLVYPGPSGNLVERAKEFIKDKTIPDHFRLVVDPDYTLTNAYHLRWEASNETAYPSTFVIQKDGKIVFAKISQSHGGRSNPDEILKVLKLIP